MVLNGIVGAGIFALPAAVAGASGGWAPLVILLVGLAMLPVVLVVARLSTLFDGTGGPILYVEHAFGGVAAFQIGWMQILSTTASAAANANVLADYALRWWTPGASDPIAHAAVVLGSLALMFAINLWSAGSVARALGLVTVAKLVPLALVIIVALPALAADGLSPQPATQWSLGQAMLLSAYAFTGFEGALTLAGEARDPKRDLPRAVLAVFIAVTFLYALLVWGYVATAYAPGRGDTAPLSTMMAVLVGGTGAVLMLATATLSIFGNVTNNMLFLSRRLLALEALGGLPRWFGRVSPTDAVPRNAVYFIGAVLALLSVSGGFAALAVISVAARLIVYLGCIAALPVITAKRGARLGRAMTVVTLSAALVCLALITGSELRSWLTLGIAAIIGIGLHIGTTMWRRRTDTGQRAAI